MKHSTSLARNLYEMLAVVWPGTVDIPTVISNY